MILLLIQKWLKRTDKTTTSSAGAPIEDEVAAIRAGDEALRGDVIARYQPYVAKTASRFCKRYIHPESDDEYSIALSAFNEAIDAFDPQAGRAFLSFAETVIRRRLTDYVRKEQRHASHIPQSAFLMEDDEGETYDPIEVDASVDRYKLDRENEERKLEIETLNRELADYGITFGDLVDGSPKHEDTRRSLIGIGALISRDSALFGPLTNKKALPLKELSERVDVSRKTLERGRKYIIAVALIHLGNYPHLQSFVAPAASVSSGAGAAAQRGENKGWEA
ncbi:RNA polymerase sigma-I factor [Paenibacillus antri]|uniref:RNA polymerase sigma factor SigI n=1 Tax=Paenibacillus antri TaxID=2582848 RepID=A0A5R9GBG3_9BACL|nr:RNA polymerase sigma-I factor [Paenibacillus antri]TLS51420.1 RNA polymerase sigma-I factor [Paenibacillus antri]